MSNSIRAAALDAAIVEVLYLGAWREQAMTLDRLHEIMWVHHLTPPTPVQGKREIRHRLQRLRAAGRIVHSRAHGWVLA